MFHSFGIQAGLASNLGYVTVVGTVAGFKLRQVSLLAAKAAICSLD